MGYIPHGFRAQERWLGSSPHDLEISGDDEIPMWKVIKAMFQTNNHDNIIYIYVYIL